MPFLAHAARGATAFRAANTSSTAESTAESIMLARRRRVARGYKGPLCLANQYELHNNMQIDLRSRSPQCYSIYYEESLNP